MERTKAAMWLAAAEIEEYLIACDFDTSLCEEILSALDVDAACHVLEHVARMYDINLDINLER